MQIFCIHRPFTIHNQTQKYTMHIFAVIGPLGAGKTTFVLNAIQALESRGFQTKQKFAYVVNDEGALIDGELARQRAKVVAMTNGCFTCDDTTELRSTLDRLEESGISWVFLEGFGLISGDETRSFLESCPYKFYILCLLSGKHFVQDQTRYAHVITSQVKVATVAIGITKYEHQRDQLPSLDSLNGLPELVASESHGMPLVFISNDVNLPEIVFKPFGEKTERETGSHSHEHCASCGCGHHPHKYSHDRRHVHSMYPYSFELRNGVTLNDLKLVFTGKDFLLRIKGAVEGRLFNEVHGDWQVSLEDRRQFVTFYALRKVEIDKELPELQALMLLKKDEGRTEPGYRQLRYDVADRESTVAEIQKLLDEMPNDPVIVSSGPYFRLLTHPETLQTLKDGIARRPSVKDEWFPVVIKRCMEYWVKCAKVMNSRSDEILPQDIGRNRRELGASMTWWVNRYHESLGSELVSQVENLHPGAMTAKGILAMGCLNSDPEKARWQCAELSEALSYGIMHGDNPGEMIRAAGHCLSIARTTEMRQEWSQSLQRLKR